MDTHVPHGQRWIPRQGWVCEARVPHVWQHRAEATRYQDVQDVEKAIIDIGSGAIRGAVISVRGEADAA